MFLRALIACTEGSVVPSRLVQAERTVRPASDERGVMIVLPVVLPEANRTDLEPATLVESEVAATRTCESPSRFRRSHDRTLVELPTVVVEPTPTSGQFLW